MKTSVLTWALVYLVCVTGRAEDSSPDSEPSIAQLSEQLQRLTATLEKADQQVLGLKQELRTFQSAQQDRQGEDGFRSLYLAGRDGSGVKHLIAAPGMLGSASPSWSPSGNMIAFDAHPQLHAFTRSHIFVYAHRGPFAGMVRDLGNGNVPSWSPDESQIAFMLNPRNPRGDDSGIWIMNCDGSNRRRVASGMYPSWSPDGKHLCIQSTERPGLDLLNLETQEITPLLGEDWKVTYSGATWSQDSQRLIFIGRSDGKQHVATMPVGGSEGDVWILYSEEDLSARLFGPPAWSPDEKQVVISRQPEKGGHHVWSGTQLYRITQQEFGPPVAEPFEATPSGVINRGMAWSPDGSMLVFSSER